MSTRKSLFFSFVDRYSGLIITLGSSMIIARLLTPAEIGVFSITMVLMMFVATFRDMGAGQYLVQEIDLTVERIRAVWTVQICLGIGLACVVMLVSYPVSVFYNEPRMRDIMLIVALNYAVTPFGSLTHAWLMREMRFDNSALIRFSGGLIGALVSTMLAWKGFGPISMAFGSLATTVVGALFAIYYRPAFFPWLPGLREVKRVLVFGSHLTFSSIVNTMASSAPELLLGKLQTLTSVGLYSRASGLVQMFHRLLVDAVGAVCVPWFAKQSREEGGFSGSFLTATTYVTALGWAFCVGVICLAHPLIRALYGTQWDDSVDLARLLILAVALIVPTSLCQVALLSSGASQTIARVTVMNAAQSVVFVAFGASLGLMGLGVAMIGSAAISAVLWMRATSKLIGLPLGKLFLALRQCGLVVSLSAIGPLISVWVFGAYPKEIFMPLLLGGTGAVAGFVVGVLVFGHLLREEFQRVLRWMK